MKSMKIVSVYLLLLALLSIFVMPTTTAIDISPSYEISPSRADYTIQFLTVNASYLSAEEIEAKANITLQVDEDSQDGIPVVMFYFRLNMTRPGSVDGDLIRIIGTLQFGTFTTMDQESMTLQMVQPVPLSALTESTVICLYYCPLIGISTYDPVQGGSLRTLSNPDTQGTRLRGVDVSASLVYFVSEYKYFIRNSDHYTHFFNRWSLLTGSSSDLGYLAGWAGAIILIAALCVSIAQYVNWQEKKRMLKNAIQIINLAQADASFISPQIAHTLSNEAQALGIGSYTTSLDYSNQFIANFYDTPAFNWRWIENLGQHANRLIWVVIGIGLIPISLYFTPYWAAYFGTVEPAYLNQAVFYYCIVRVIWGIILNSVYFTPVFSTQAASVERSLAIIEERAKLHEIPLKFVRSKVYLGALFFAFPVASLLLAMYVGYITAQARVQTNVLATLREQKSEESKIASDPSSLPFKERAKGKLTAFKEEFTVRITEFGHQVWNVLVIWGANLWRMISWLFKWLLQAVMWLIVLVVSCGNLFWKACVRLYRGFKGSTVYHEMVSSSKSIVDEMINETLTPSASSLEELNEPVSESIPKKTGDKIAAAESSDVPLKLDLTPIANAIDSKSNIQKFDITLTGQITLKKSSPAASSSQHKAHQQTETNNNDDSALSEGERAEDSWMEKISQNVDKFLDRGKDYIDNIKATAWYQKIAEWCHNVAERIKATAWYQKIAEWCHNAAERIKATAWYQNLAEWARDFFGRVDRLFDRLFGGLNETFSPKNKPIAASYVTESDVAHGVQQLSKVAKFVPGYGTIVSNTLEKVAKNHRAQQFIANTIDAGQHLLQQQYAGIQQPLLGALQPKPTNWFMRKLTGKKTKPLATPKQIQVLAQSLHSSSPPEFKAYALAVAVDQLQAEENALVDEFTKLERQSKSAEQRVEELVQDPVVQEHTRKSIFNELNTEKKRYLIPGYYDASMASAKIQWIILFGIAFLFTGGFLVVNYFFRWPISNLPIALFVALGCLFVGSTAAILYSIGWSAVREPLYEGQDILDLLQTKPEATTPDPIATLSDTPAEVHATQTKASPKGPNAVATIFTEGLTNRYKTLAQNPVYQRSILDHSGLRHANFWSMFVGISILSAFYWMSNGFTLQSLTTWQCLTLIGWSFSLLLITQYAWLTSLMLSIYVFVMRITVAEQFVIWSGIIMVYMVIWAVIFTGLAFYALSKTDNAVFLYRQLKDPDQPVHDMYILYCAERIHAQRGVLYLPMIFIYIQQILTNWTSLQSVFDFSQGIQIGGMELLLISAVIFLLFIGFDARVLRQFDYNVRGLAIWPFGILYGLDLICTVVLQVQFDIAIFDYYPMLFLVKLVLVQIGNTQRGDAILYNTETRETKSAQFVELEYARSHPPSASSLPDKKDSAAAASFATHMDPINFTPASLLRRIVAFLLDGWILGCTMIFLGMVENQYHLLAVFQILSPNYWWGGIGIILGVFLIYQRLTHLTVKISLWSLVNICGLYYGVYSAFHSEQLLTTIRWLIVLGIYAYFWIFEAFNGQTLGKMICRIQTCSNRGDPISANQATLLALGTLLFPLDLLGGMVLSAFMPKHARQIYLSHILTNSQVIDQFLSKHAIDTKQQSKRTLVGEWENNEQLAVEYPNYTRIDLLNTPLNHEIHSDLAREILALLGMVKQTRIQHIKDALDIHEKKEILNALENLRRTNSIALYTQVPKESRVLPTPKSIALDTEEDAEEEYYAQLDAQKLSRFQAEKINWGDSPPAIIQPREEDAANAPHAVFATLLGPDQEAIQNFTSDSLSPKELLKIKAKANDMLALLRKKQVEVAASVYLAALATDQEEDSP